MFSKSNRHKKRYTVVVCEWQNGVWTKTEFLFDTFGQAKHFAKKTEARCKVYGLSGILEYDNEYDCEHTSPYC